jgi:hypothetical protein
MNNNQKVKYCLIMSTTLLILIIAIMIVFSDEPFVVGPNHDLIILSMRIDTNPKYCGLLGLIFLIKSITVMVNELSYPVLGFSVYNPDKTVIVDFTKNELQFYANMTFFVSSMRETLMLYVSIGQIDLAIFGTLISELASILTIRFLLNEKKFEKQSYNLEPEMYSLV